MASRSRSMAAPLRRSKATLPTTFGAIIRVDHAINVSSKKFDENQTDVISRVVPRLNYSCDIYYNAVLLGYHHDVRGDMLRLMSRSQGYDAYSGMFIEYGQGDVQLDSVVPSTLAEIAIKKSTREYVGWGYLMHLPMGIVVSAIGCQVGISSSEFGSLYYWQASVEIGARIRTQFGAIRFGATLESGELPPTEATRGEINSTSRSTRLLIGGAIALNFQGE